jgi:hypothetical protein
MTNVSNILCDDWRLESLRICSQIEYEYCLNAQVDEQDPYKLLKWGFTEKVTSLKCSRCKIHILSLKCKYERHLWKVF